MTVALDTRKRRVSSFQDLFAIAMEEGDTDNPSPHNLLHYLPPPVGKRVAAILSHIHLCLVVIICDCESCRLRTPSPADNALLAATDYGEEALRFTGTVGRRVTGKSLSAAAYLGRQLALACSPLSWKTRQIRV